MVKTLEMSMWIDGSILMFEFSISIPAHDRGKNGPKWMTELLDSLERQTFQDFEVVVSDHSKKYDIMKVCKDYDFHFT